LIFSSVNAVRSIVVVAKLAKSFGIAAIPKPCDFHYGETRQLFFER